MPDKLSKRKVLESFNRQYLITNPFYSSISWFTQSQQNAYGGEEERMEVLSCFLEKKFMDKYSSNYGTVLYKYYLDTVWCHSNIAFKP